MNEKQMLGAALVVIVITTAVTQGAIAFHSWRGTKEYLKTLKKEA